MPRGAPASAGAPAPPAREDHADVGQWRLRGQPGRLAMTELQLTLQIVKRSDGITGFVVLPHRWCVERTLSWIFQRRRCVRDYERLPGHHEAIVKWAMIILMGRAASQGPHGIRSLTSQVVPSGSAICSQALSRKSLTPAGQVHFSAQMANWSSGGWAWTRACGPTTCGSWTRPRCSAVAPARPLLAATWPGGRSTATAPVTPGTSGVCGCTSSAHRTARLSCSQSPGRRPTSARFSSPCPGSTQCS
jgi:hypothetical protein